MTPKRLKALIYVAGVGLAGAAYVWPALAPVFVGVAVFLRSPLTEQALEDLASG